MFSFSQYTMYIFSSSLNVLAFGCILNIILTVPLEHESQAKDPRYISIVAALDSSTLF
jgi:hypothetical protein